MPLRLPHMPLRLTQPGPHLAGFFKRLITVRPREAKLTVGLDVGSSALKLVALGGRKASGARALLGQTLIAFGEAADDARVSSAIQEAVSHLHVPVKAVNLSVSGQWVIMRVVEMPPMTPVELTKALPFEAQRHLPFNVEDVVLDGTILGPAEHEKVWALIVACKRELLERRLGWLKQAGLQPAVMDVDALALANAFARRRDGQRLSGTHALLNLGAQWANLVVLKEEVPYLVRDIPWGTAKLIRHVAEQLGVDEASVASSLRQHGSLPTEFLAAMKGACETMAADLQLSFDFFESRFGTPPDRVWLSGGASCCPSISDALKSHLAQSLLPWEPLDGLTSQFAVAYGLALRT